MDFSKLPKLSKTDTPPNAAESGEERSAQPQVATLWCGCGSPVPAGSRFCPSCGKSFGNVGAAAAPDHPVEAYFNIAIGLLLALMFPRFWQWTCSRLFGTKFNEFMLDEKVVPYTQVPEFLADLGPASFALMLIADGILAGVIGRSWAIASSLVIASIVTVFNFGYLVSTFSSRGLAVMSAFAAVYGGFIVYSRWQTLKAQKIAPAAGKTAGAQGGRES